MYSDFLRTLDALFTHQAIEKGMKVRIVNVKSQPQLNGQIGVVGNFDIESQRYAIDIGGKTRAFKEENLEEADGAIVNGSTVILQGLNRKPELNGRTGTIKGFVEESSRYAVELDGSDYALRRDNLELISKGALVDLIYLDLDMFGYDYQGSGEQGHGILVFRLSTD